MTSKIGRGGRRYQPIAFTEHGAIMLAAVLRSATAVQARRLSEHLLWFGLPYLLATVALAAPLWIAAAAGAKGIVGAYRDILPAAAPAVSALIMLTVRQWQIRRLCQDDDQGSRFFRRFMFGVFLVLYGGMAAYDFVDEFDMDENKWIKFPQLAILAVGHLLIPDILVALFMLPIAANARSAVNRMSGDRHR